LPVGVEQPGLGVGEPEVAAVFADQWLYETEVGPGHVREEVVLDMVVQPAEEPVRDRPAPDIPRSQDLAAQILSST